MAMGFLYEFYGYFLHGTGSAIYTRDITRALNRLGQNVVLFSQENKPESFDFISEAYEVRNGLLKRLFSRSTPFSGKTIHVRPDLKGMLPVYVYDSYPDYEKVVEFKNIGKDKLDAYRERITEAVQLFIRETGKKPSGYLTHHLSPLPAFVESIRDKKAKHFAVYHGSDINFALIKNDLLKNDFIQVLPDISGIIVLTSHGRDDVISFLGGKNLPKIAVIPPGVDTEKFYPKKKDDALHEFKEKFSRLEHDASLLSKRLELIKAIYESNSLTDLKLMFKELEKLEAVKAAEPDVPDFLKKNKGRPLVVFAGKYLWTKGIAALLLAMPYVWKEADGTDFVLVGFGASRGILEKIRFELSRKNIKAVCELLEKHKELDPGSKEDLIYDAPLDFAGRLKNTEFAGKYLALTDFSKFITQVKFAGYLDHDRLAPLISLADVFAAPSLFKESFGLVLVEAAASGALPVGSCHSGFKDVLKYYAAGLQLNSEEICIQLDGNFIPGLGKAIVATVEKIRSDKSIKSRLFELTQYRFSWESAASNLLNLFKTECA